MSSGLLLQDSSIPLKASRLAGGFLYSGWRPALGRPARRGDRVIPETSEVWKMIGLPMACHALGRKADSDAALAALIEKWEKDPP
jgi:hypothetical protein